MVVVCRREILVPAEDVNLRQYAGWLTDWYGWLAAIFFVCMLVVLHSTVVHADALVPNAKQTLFAATNLVTPLGRYAHAVLRDQDVALIERHITPEQLCTLLQHEHHAT